MRDARFKARSVCKVTSASGIGKLHIELTRAFSALVIWGNRIPGTLPEVRDECCAFGAKDALGNSIGRLVDNAMLTINLHS